MPWSYPNNVPAVAKNWTAGQQKACITAANAVLREGGSDSDAIFACIHAAGKSKKGDSGDDLGKRFTLLGAAKAKRRGRKMPKPPRPPNIKLLQMRYFKELRGLVQTLKQLTKEYLLTQVDAIVESAKLLRPANDSARNDYFELVEDVMGDLRVQTYRRYTEEEMAAMAGRAADNVNAANGRYYDRLAFKILGVSGIRSEPWLQQEVAAFTKMNVSLIKSIPEKYFEQVEQIVTRGAQSGALGKDITAKIKSRFKVTENRALLIARDQVAKFNSDLNQLRQTESGISKYMWQTAGDERVRSEHEANDGRVFSWSDPPSTGHPGEDVNCRCVAVPVLE